MPLQRWIFPSAQSNPSVHSQLPAKTFPTPGCPAAHRSLSPLCFAGSHDGTTGVKAGWRLLECHQTKLRLRLAARHSRPPPDSWGVSSQGGPALVSTGHLPASLPGAWWHPEGWEAMPAPPAKLSSPAVDLWLSTGRCARQSFCECSVPENKAVQGWRGNADPGCCCWGSGEGMIRGCLEGKHCFFPLLACRGFVLGEQMPCLATVTGSSAGDGL